jgi:hypothetical protein
MTNFSLQAHAVSARTQRVLIALVAIMGFFFVGIAVAAGYYFIPILLLALPFSVIALRAQEKLIFPIIAACFLAEYGIWLLDLPSAAIYCIHLLILTMFGVILLKKFVGREKGIHSNAFVLIWMFYLVLLLFMNSSIGIFSLQKLMGFYLYPLLFLGVLNIRKGQRFDKRILSFLLFFIALQFPVVVVQKFIYWHVSPDRVGGTLRYAGGTHLIAMLMSQFWCFVLALFLLSRKRTIAHYMLLLLPFIPLGLGSANAGFLFAMGSGAVIYGVYFFFLRAGGMLRKLTGFVTILLPILFALFFLTYLLPRFDPKFSRVSAEAISSVDGMIRYMTGHQKEYRNTTLYTPANRLEQVKIVASITKNIYLGNGLGSLNDSPLLGLSNATFPQAYRLVLSWATSLTEFLLETGVVGVFLYVAAILSFAVKAFAIVRRSKDEFWRIYSLGFIGMAAVIVVASLYADAWKGYPVAGSFWICAAILERVHGRMGAEGKFLHTRLGESPTHLPYQRQSREG